jgi:hypothetical protein
MYQLHNFPYIIIHGKQRQQDPNKISQEKLKFINMPKDVLPTDGYLVSTIQMCCLLCATQSNPN